MFCSFRDINKNRVEVTLSKRTFAETKSNFVTNLISKRRGEKKERESDGDVRWVGVGWVGGGKRRTKETKSQNQRKRETGTETNIKKNYHGFNPESLTIVVTDVHG